MNTSCSMLDGNRWELHHEFRSVRRFRRTGFAAQSIRKCQFVALQDLNNTKRTHLKATLQHWRVTLFSVLSLKAIGSSDAS